MTSKTTDPTDPAYGFVFFVVERKQLLHDKQALDKTLSAMRSVVQRSKKATCNLSFDGYEQDPRNVWHIGEVRDFCYRVMREVPQLYLVGDDTTKAVLLFCTNVILDGEPRVNPEWAPYVPQYSMITLSDWHTGQGT